MSAMGHGFSYPRVQERCKELTMTNQILSVGSAEVDHCDEGGGHVDTCAQEDVDKIYLLDEDKLGNFK